MTIFNDIQKKKESDQQKEVEDNHKRISALTFKIIEWLSNDGILLKDAIVALQVTQQTFQQVMQKKTLPIINEWNERSVKDFYASSKDNLTTSS